MPSENDSIDDLQRLKIEDELPLKTIGIENLREKSNHFDFPPQDYLHVWFARRPTPAARLSVLASVLPNTVSNDELLELMQISPKQHLDEPIADYVERRALTEDQRSGSKADHYGYPKPFKSSPSEEQLSDLHSVLRDHWDGDLPTVLDATAGGGSIPFESLRYDLPTNANELNSVPSLILKTMLEYAPEVGSLQEEIEKWGRQIDEVASEELEEYFPTDDEGRETSHTICTYTVSCSSCGCDIPLAPKWWLKKEGKSTGVAVQPHVVDDHVDYELVHLPDDVSKSEFNPTKGPVTRGGDAECMSCGVVTESAEIKERFQNGEFEYEPYAVKYEDEDGAGFRAVTDADYNAIERAEDRVNSDLDFLTLLATSIPDGSKTREPHSYGITEWRDMFSPRQLLTQATYLEAFNEVKSDIRAEYGQEKAEALLVLLTFVSDKLVDYNSRLTYWIAKAGRPSNIFSGNNFGFKRVFTDNNYAVGGMSYQSALSRITKSYEEIVDSLPSEESAVVSTGDAASLPYDDEEIQVVSVDPPYYDSIMYAELSDVFYVWLKEYLGDTHPGLFQSNLSNKTDEAVANTAKFNDSEGSKTALAKQDYEDKMSDIFTELYRVLEPGGAMTVMFTHKETDAWDTLTMSLINAGFVVTSTHPITSEMPQRAEMRDSNSADSTILLTGRKPQNPTPIEERTPSLWSEVEDDFQRVAREKAEDLLESGLSLTKTDLIIGAFGPTLRTFTEKYPVVDDTDEPVSPEKALEAARTVVTNVLAERFLDVSDDFDDLHGLTKWYVLAWLVYESDTLPYDDGRQLGVGVGVDVDDIKKSTKIWGKKSGDIQLKASDERVQNIIKLEDEQDVSSRKYPVDPRDENFEYAIDTIHTALHIYDHKGARYAENWLRDRRLHSDERFRTALKALMDVLPNDHPDAKIGKNLLSGKTGDLLDIDATGLFEDSRDNHQAKLDGDFGDADNGEDDE